jgi:antitoxin (DNA-binding transcriptional repressor) of toxin-antitoxin stability system
MKTSVKELRASMKQVLDRVQHGEEVEVYLRDKAIAKIIPIKERVKVKEDYGFGMWSDRADMKDADQYVRGMRRGRSHDD